MKTLSRVLALVLSFLMAFPPALASAASDAATTKEASAPQAQVELLKRLAETGPLENLKPYLKEVMAPTDITTALAGIYPDVKRVDLAALRPGDEDYPFVDWTDLLALVREKKGALRTKGLSAWAYEKKLVDITGALSPKGEVLETSPAVKAKAPALAPTETPVPPPPAVSNEEVQALRVRLSEVADHLERMAKESEKRRQDDEATEKSRQADRAAQKEDLRLMKNLLDALQGDLAKANDRLEVVGKKADENHLTDTDLRQSLTLMRKDLRDNVEDVSILKQKVEKLMAPEKQYARPLDKALTSKWIPGAALLIALGAIIWTASKK